MSYCRWSCLNFECDVYAYEDVNGGWTTHVASYRLSFSISPLPDILSVSTEEYLKAYRKQRKDLEQIQRVPIGLPYDGQTFNDDTLEDFRGRLLMLRKIGYRIPDYTFEMIDDELREGQLT